jgi:predicted permease
MMRWAEDSIRDLCFAIRNWGTAPDFAITAIATLALGIGANTAIFSVVSGVLLRPLPFAHPERLVELDEIQPRSRFGPGFDGTLVYQDFEEWRTKSRYFEAMVTYTSSTRNLQDAGEPEQVVTVSAERGLFRLLGVSTMCGRTFVESDPANVAVASYGFWKGLLGGERSAIGRSITLDGQSFTLIGVMPEGFQFPYRRAPIGLCIPWQAPPDLRSHPTRRLDAVLARMKPGVSMEVARQELAAMEAPSRGGRLVRIRELKDVVSAPARQSLVVLLGAVGMVLLVACVNVTNLLLARTASRSREIAIRAALGAGRFRLLRQFLTESLLLVFCGGVAGLAISGWASNALVKLAAPEVPRAAEIGLDWRVFAFLLTVCVAAGIGFGLAQAMAAARGGADALKSRGVGVTFRDALVVLEIALAFILLAGAGLLLRTFVNLERTDPGLRAENVLTAHVVVSGARESMALEERARQIPGVRVAGLVSLLPLQNPGWGAGTTIPGRPGWFETQLGFVTPGYFRAMGIPLRRGRESSPHDGPDAPRVILVNEAFVRQCFPTEDPIGRTTDRGAIIGVVGDVRQAALSAPAKPEIYYAMAQDFGQIRSHGSTLVVRSTGPPEALAGAVRAAVREVVPGQAVFRIATMQRVIEESLAKPRSYTWLVGLFAAMGTLLAIAGIYGVIAYLVALRTREFGIRMALGADTGRVLRLVMERGAVLVALGVALGISGAVTVTRVLRGALYGVAAADPATFATMAAVLGAVAMVASLVPARRAARVDPAAALRTE